MEHRKIHGFPTKWSKLKLRRDRNKSRQLPSCQEHLSPRTSLHRCSSLGCLSSLVTLKMTGLPWVKHTKKWGIPTHPWTKNLQIMFFHVFFHICIFTGEYEYSSTKYIEVSSSNWLVNRPDPWPLPINLAVSLWIRGHPRAPKSVVVHRASTSYSAPGALKPVSCCGMFIG